MSAQLELTKTYFEEYMDFTESMYIANGPMHPPLLRAGLELAEESFEYLCDMTKDELGDICFWFGFISSRLGYKRTYKDDANGKFFKEVVRDLVGSIKRYFRDNNMEKLDEILQVHLPALEYWLSTIAKSSFEMTLEDLMRLNQEKLVKRSQNKSTTTSNL